MKTKHSNRSQNYKDEEDDNVEVDDESSQLSTASSVEAPTMDMEQDIGRVVTNDDDDDDATDGVDVWAVLREVANRTHNGDICEAVRSQMLYCRALRRDDTIIEITKTIKNAQYEEDMDFGEALSYAINKRLFLIKRKVQEEDDADSQQ